MNERIKQLLTQAGVGDNWNEADWYSLSPEMVEKFAELIVQECADLFVDQKYMILNPHEPFANERIRELKDHDMDTVRKIKGHFGVK
jgi:hypothetical protein